MVIHGTQSVPISQRQGERTVIATMGQWQITWVHDVQFLIAGTNESKEWTTS